MIRIISMVSVTAFCVLGLANISAAESSNLKSLPRFAPDKILVAFRPGTPAADIAAVHAASRAHVLRNLDAIGVQVLAVAAGTVLEQVAFYQRNPNVRYAEPNYLRPLIIPTEGQEPAPSNFSYFDEQYGLHNTGQGMANPDTGEIGTVHGTPDADMDWVEATDLSDGGGIIIAVIDSGVECTHVDLMAKCVETTSFLTGVAHEDDVGHGTHVAGIAAASTNNGTGIAGTGYNAQFASLKVCYADFFFGGVCDDAAAIDAIIHAANMGYQVINMSFGSPDFSNALQDAIDYAWSMGALPVSSAGNSYNSNLGYPAALDNVISVAATDWHDNLAYFSNFGWVDVAAPGRNTFSTYPNAACGIGLNDPEGCYTWMSGTSMASPHVAGVAALVWSANPGATNAEVRGWIENTADSTGAAGQNMLAWTVHGRVNAHAAITAALGGGNPGPGGSAVTLSAIGYKVKGEKTADLTWNGATTADVLIRRDGAPLATTLNNGAYTDATGVKGSGSHTYQVCETGVGAPCSAEVTVSF